MLIAKEKQYISFTAPEIKLTTEVFVETSETLSLKCMILHLDPGDTKPVLHWYKGNSTVPIDEVRGGVLIETDLNNLTSHLQVIMIFYLSIHNLVSCRVVTKLLRIS